MTKNIVDMELNEIIKLGDNIIDEVQAHKTKEMHVGINLGNLFTKNWGENNKHFMLYTSAQKVTGELSQEEIQSDTGLIRVNGELYRVGLPSVTAGNFAERSHDSLTVIGLYSMARLFCEDKKNITGTGNSRFQLCKAKIGLGLSNDDYDIKENQKTLLEMFNGKNFVIEYLKARFVVNVEVMNIMIEGQAHIRFHHIDYDYPEVVLLDIGSRTWDYCRFVKNTFDGKTSIVEKESIDKAGTLSIMKDISKKIGAKKVKPEDVEPLIRGEKINIDGVAYEIEDFADIVKSNIETKRAELGYKIEGDLSTARCIVLAGGGAEMIRPFMEELYPGKPIIVAKNPQYINADAYFIGSYKKRNFKKLYE